MPAPEGEAEDPGAAQGAAGAGRREQSLAVGLGFATAPLRTAETGPLRLRGSSSCPRRQGGPAAGAGAVVGRCAAAAVWHARGGLLGASAAASADSGRAGQAAEGGGRGALGRRAVVCRRGCAREAASVDRGGGPQSVFDGDLKQQ